MSELNDRYKEYKKMTTESLKKELREEQYVYDCEKIESDITAAHTCHYCLLNIEAINKVLKERGL